MISKLEHLQFRQHGIVFDPELGLRLQANDSACFLLRQLQKEADAAAALRALMEEYDLSQTEAERAYLAFHILCSRSGLKLPELELQSKKAPALAEHGDSHASVA